MFFDGLQIISFGTLLFFRSILETDLFFLIIPIFVRGSSISVRRAFSVNCQISSAVEVCMEEFCQL